MQAIITIFLYLFFISKVVSIPVICISTSPQLVINTECSNLRIFKLNQKLCDSELKRINIEPDVDTKRFWFDHHSSGLSIFHFKKNQFESIPNLFKVISEICPFEDFLTNNIRFLSLKDNDMFDHANEVVLSVRTANGLSGNNGTYINFYQDSPEVLWLPFESEPSLSMKSINKALKVFNDDANYTIQSAKLYSQYCQQIPEDVIKTESKLALENPFKHTIDLVIILIYEFMNATVPKKVNEYHELIEVCLRNDLDNQTHHVLIDRNAIAKEKLKYWNSKVNMYYIGEGDGCELESNKWTDVKTGICEDTGHPCLITRTYKKNLNYSMNKMIKLCTNFLLNYRIFNSIFNCQHFATNVWNTIANDTLDFENWEIMGVHSPFTNLEGKISFLDHPI